MPDHTWSYDHIWLMAGGFTLILTVNPRCRCDSHRMPRTATDVPLSKSPPIRFGGSLERWWPGQNGILDLDERKGIVIYENKIKQLCLGSGACRFR